MKTPKFKPEAQRAEELAAAAAVAEQEAAAARNKAIGEAMEAARERLGPERLDKLTKQSPCIAAGGIEAVLLTAASECHGYPNPSAAVACRALQLCGTKPAKEDIA